MLAAERTRAVRRIDQRLVGKREGTVVEGVVEMRAEIVGGPAEQRAQIGAADIADEESVAREDGAGFGGLLLKIEHEDGNGLDGVAGSFEDSRRRPGKLSVSPFFIGTKAHCAWARAPRWMVAPQRSRSSRWLATKSAWK
jgi:hypothetical protein